VITVPFGNSRPSAARVTVPSGSTRESRGAGCLAAVPVEAEVADVGAAAGVHHHVVAGAGGDRREIGVKPGLAALRAQEAAIEHGDYEQGPVGQPAEAGRPLRDLQDGLDAALRGHREDALGVEVGEPQAAVVPARPFGEGQPVEERRQHGRRG